MSNGTDKTLILLMLHDPLLLGTKLAVEVGLQRAWSLITEESLFGEAKPPTAQARLGRQRTPSHRHLYYT
jgi:hypothetical protein